MELGQHKPILKRLLFYLCPADALSLMYVYPLATRVLKEGEYDHQYWVYKALRSLGLQEVFIRHVMHHCQQGTWALTGSVLMMAIYGVTYDNVHDIDIISVDERVPVPGYLQSEVLDDFEHIPRKPSLELSYAERHRPAYSNPFLREVSEVYVPSSRGDIAVQLLRMQGDLQKSVSRFVAHFDYTFCKNYFFRNKIHIQHPESVTSKTHSGIYSLEDHSFLHGIKSFEYLYHKFLPSKYARMRRYHERGFHCRYVTTTRYRDAIPDASTPIPPMWSRLSFSIPVFVRGAMAGMWFTFWEDRIDANGTLRCDRVPEWKRMDEYERLINDL